MTEIIASTDDPEVLQDAERIVRCKDCRRWNGIENALGQRICERSGKFCKPNGFCAWGERKKK